MTKTEYHDYSSPINFYDHSYMYAKENSQTNDYYKSYNYNLECKDAIEQTIDKSYDDVFGKMEPGVASALVGEYGTDRIAYILQETINNRIWDGRLSMDNRAWSVGVGAYFKHLDYAKGLNHDLTTSSAALNKFVSQFRKETHFDPALTILGTEKDPYPFVYLHSYKSASLSNELPQYLWSWGLNCKCARALDPEVADPSLTDFSKVLDQFGLERVSVVLAETLDFYKNNQDISEDNKAWARSIDLPKTASVKDMNMVLIHTNAASMNTFMNECLSVLKDRAMGAEDQERSLLEDIPEQGLYNYGIYQISNDRSGYQFEGEEFLRENHIHVNPEDYAFVYGGACKQELNKQDVLDDLFVKFNIDRPEGFKGYSLSVSDVIVLNDGGNGEAFYIDKIGYLELPDFIEGRRDMLDEPLDFQEQELSCSR